MESSRHSSRLSSLSSARVHPGCGSLLRGPLRSTGLTQNLPAFTSRSSRTTEHYSRYASASAPAAKKPLQHQQQQQKRPTHGSSCSVALPFSTSSPQPPLRVADLKARPQQQRRRAPHRSSNASSRGSATFARSRSLEGLVGPAQRSVRKPSGGAGAQGADSTAYRRSASAVATARGVRSTFEAPTGMGTAPHEPALPAGCDEGLQQANDIVAWCAGPDHDDAPAVPLYNVGSPLRRGTVCGFDPTPIRPRSRHCSESAPSGQVNAHNLHDTPAGEPAGSPAGKAGLGAGPEPFPENGVVGEGAGMMVLSTAHVRVLEVHAETVSGSEQVVLPRPCAIDRRETHAARSECIVLPPDEVLMQLMARALGSLSLEHLHDNGQ